jgi:hypothetical protein
VRPELGYFQVEYQWYKPESQLFVFVDSAYGRFNIRVDGFADGDLGLNFVDVPEPKHSAFHGREQSTQEILDSWTPSHDALQSFVDSAQIINIPSPGEPIDGDASPVTPVADTNWIPYPNYGDDPLMATTALAEQNLHSQALPTALAAAWHI